MRKPKNILSNYPNNIQIYAGLNDRSDPDCVVYVGGRSYQDSVQIHLNEKEIHLLSKYLVKASAYLKSKK